MTRDQWSAVDDYYEGLLGLQDPHLQAALDASAAAGLPAINVSPLQGRFLELLARTSGARAVLEIGTLGGYSTISLARALPADGRLVTLELSAHHAEVARGNLDRAGVGDLVDIRVGPATESLAALRAEGARPFDFVFIDADKPGYADYLAAVLPLSRHGTVIVADNVVRGGAVVDADSADPNVQGIRHFNTVVQQHPQLSATAVQTVGVKGHDGFLLAVVTA